MAKDEGEKAARKETKKTSKRSGNDVEDKEVIPVRKSARTMGNKHGASEAKATPVEEKKDIGVETAATSTKQNGAEGVKISKVYRSLCCN